MGAAWISVEGIRFPADGWGGWYPGVTGRYIEGG